MKYKVRAHRSVACRRWSGALPIAVPGDRSCGGLYFHTLCFTLFTNALPTDRSYWLRGGGGGGGSGGGGERSSLRQLLYKV